MRIASTFNGFRVETVRCASVRHFFQGGAALTGLRSMHAPRAREDADDEVAPGELHRIRRHTDC